MIINVRNETGIIYLIYFEIITDNVNLIIAYTLPKYRLLKRSGYAKKKK